MKKLVAAVMVCMFWACGCADKTEGQISGSLVPSADISAEISQEEQGTVDVKSEGDTGEEAEVVWTNDNVNDEKTESLVNDYIRAMAKECYGQTNKITKYEYNNAEISSEDAGNNYKAIKFDLSISYNPIDQTTSELGAEETKTFPCRITVNAKNGKIDPSTFAGYTGEINEKQSIYKAFPEPNTYFGKIRFRDGKLVLSRMLFADETGGYTDDGYFIADSGLEYTFAVNEKTTVSYYKEDNVADSMTIDEFTEKDVENKYYVITVNNMDATDINEVVLP